MTKIKPETKDPWPPVLFHVHTRAVDVADLYGLGRLEKEAVSCRSRVRHAKLLSWTSIALYVLFNLANVVQLPCPQKGALWRGSPDFELLPSGAEWWYLLRFECRDGSRPSGFLYQDRKGINSPASSFQRTETCSSGFRVAIKTKMQMLMRVITFWENCVQLLFGENRPKLLLCAWFSLGNFSSDKTFFFLPRLVCWRGTSLPLVFQKCCFSYAFENCTVYCYLAFRRFLVKSAVRESFQKEIFFQTLTFFTV